MKLPTANLSKTLQNNRPMQKLSGKLKRAAGRRGARKISAGKGAIASPLAVAESPSTHASSAAIAHSTETNVIPGFIRNAKLTRNSKGARVAFHLLLVKPWVLVIGLWLVSALSAVVAIEGLVSPSKLTDDLPEPVVEVAPVAKTNSFINVEQGAEGITEDGKEPEASTPETSEVAVNSRLPIWPLVTLVGSCAAGCVVISRRRAMLQIAAARANGKGRKLKTKKAKPRNAPARLKASNSKPTRRAVSAPGTLTPVTAIKSTTRLVDKTKATGGKAKPVENIAPNLGKKRRQRQRPNPQQTAIKPSGKSRVLVSRSNVQQAAPQSRVSQPKKPQPQSQEVTRLVRRQPVVSVVPANHANRLDWVEGSLAHDMDKRFSMEEASTPRRVS